MKRPASAALPAAPPVWTTASGAAVARPSDQALVAGVAVLTFSAPCMMMHPASSMTLQLASAQVAQMVRAAASARPFLVHYYYLCCGHPCACIPALPPAPVIAGSAASLQKWHARKYSRAAASVRLTLERFFVPAVRACVFPLRRCPPAMDGVPCALPR